MKFQDIAYSADGADMVGYLATPTEGGIGPAVLLGHEGPGHSDHVRIRARRLAAMGYVAFALDYHGGGKAIPMDQAMGALRGWWADPTGIRTRAKAALDILTAQPGVDPKRVAAIGYCFGGTTALELARAGEEIAAVVGFHAGLQTARPQDAVNIKGKVLVCIGAADPLVPPEQRTAFETEMTEAKVDWRMNLYGGVEHSFTNPDADAANMPGIKFHGLTDRRSWRAMIDLFSETIGVP
jgi:dienelactone hydrolase